MNESSPIVLVVDDEVQIRRFLRAGLELDGFVVQDAETGNDALKSVTLKQPDLVILDLGLPDMDGGDVLERLRSWSTVPLIVLSVRSNEAEKVRLLESGADDYVVKPFELRELMARMRAVIRRFGGHAQSTIGTAQTRLDLSSRELTHGETTSALSAKEFHLMHALLEHPGSVLSRTQLEERIYGWDDEVASNTVEVLIHGVRRKFGADVIRNVRGLGWCVSKADA